MDNRNRDRGYGQQNDRDRWSRYDRQDEQFSSGGGQYGENGGRFQNNDRWGGQDQDNQRYGGGRGYGDSSQRDYFARSVSGYRNDTSSLDDYDRQGTTRYGPRETTHNYFRADDYGGQDYTRGGGGYGQAHNSQGYGSSSYGGGFGGASYGGAYGGGAYGADMYDRGGRGSIPPRRYDRDDRGFFDRATDEVMSWFGDDEAARRRAMDHREDHRGKGPSGYTRSKERMLEDANERLMHDPSLDASNITVRCDDNEITLDGTVDSRWAKRRAEDIVDSVAGVKHVQNNLRVESRDSYYGTSGSSATGGSSGTTGTTGSGSSKTQA